MIRNPQLFFEELKQKRVGVAGLGVSHFELIRLMLRKGISVTVLDKREMAALGEDGRILEKRERALSLGRAILTRSARLTCCSARRACIFSQTR